MLLRLKVFVEPNDVLMSGLLQDHNFLHDFLGLAVVLEVCRVDGLDRYHLFGKHLHRDVDFPECAFTQHFADSVELNGCSWAFLLEFE